MKKIIGFFIIALIMTSCYDDYVKDFEYDAVYFTYQHDVRTFVVGEGMKVNFGVGLGGVLTNDRNRIVDFAIDTMLIRPDLVGLAALTEMKESSLDYIKSSTAGVNKLMLLPASYYSLSDRSKFIIQNEKNAGMVTIRPDSAAFLADTLSLNPNYVLPLRITSADADSVLSTKMTTIIGVKYENMLFGNYWHGGVTLVKNASGIIIDTIYYYTSIPSSEKMTWSLKTIAPFELTANAYGNVSNSVKQELKIKLDGTNVTVSSAPGASYTYEADGTSTYNKAKLLQNRKIFLK